MNNVFFQQFLMISDVKTIIFLIALIAIIMVINRLPKQKFNFSAKVMTATVIGLILGLVIQFVAGFPNDPMELTFVRETTLWYSLLGSGFISLVRMLVIPLVMVSIIHVIINMKEDANLGSLVKRTLVVSLVMVAVAVAVGLTLGIIFKVGKVDIDKIKKVNTNSINIKTNIVIKWNIVFFRIRSCVVNLKMI